MFSLSLLLHVQKTPVHPTTNRRPTRPGQKAKTITVGRIRKTTGVGFIYRYYWLMTTAAIYARQSRDKKTSITEQGDIGTAEASEQGWAARVYTDGVSASRFSTKARQGWDSLRADVAARQIDVVWLWEPSRGSRSLGLWVEFLDECRDLGVTIWVHTEERMFDLSRWGDYKMLADAGVDSAGESEKISKRVQRSTAARAKAGKPHGRTAYGWDKVPVLDADGDPITTQHGTLVKKDVINAEQAGAIREATTRLLARESVRSIVVDFNGRGIAAPNGGNWSGTTLRQVVLRERNAGRRVHRARTSSEVFDGDWEPIVPPDEFDRLKAMMSDPQRRTARGNAPVHLLSHLAVCGLCGAGMKVSARHTSGGKTQPAAYTCSGCFRIRRRQDLVDRAVEAVLLARLSQADGPDLLAGDPVALREATDTVATLTARQNLAADQYADGEITAEQLSRINARLTPKINAARAVVQASAPTPELADLAGPNVAEAWASAGIGARRAVIDLLVTVRILPSGPGKAFDPRTVEITWRQPQRV